MNALQESKQIISHILQLIDYQENREVAANMFITLCWGKTVSLLLESLPTEKKDHYMSEIKRLKDTDIDGAQNITKRYFTQEQIAHALQKASKEETRIFLEAIIPTLTKEQKEKLSQYLQSLQN